MARFKGPCPSVRPPPRACLHPLVGPLSVWPPGVGQMARVSGICLPNSEQTMGTACHCALCRQMLGPTRGGRSSKK